MQCCNARDVVSWNTIITGFVNIGNFETALEFLKSMKRDGYSFGSMLKGVGSIRYVEVGQQLLNDPHLCKLKKQVHGKIMKHGFASHTCAVP